MSYVNTPHPQAAIRGLGYSWDNTSSDPDTQALQYAINGVLTTNGMQAIATDGKLGAGTCGAAQWCDQNAGTTFVSDNGLASICQSYTAPKKAGTSSAAPKAVVKTAAPSSSLAPSQGTSTIFGMQMSTVGIIAVGAVAAVMFLGKKKKAAA